MTSRHNYAMREGKQKGEGQKIFDCNCAIGRFCPRAHINNMATISVASECKSINSLLIGLFVFLFMEKCFAILYFSPSLPPPSYQPRSLHHVNFILILAGRVCEAVDQKCHVEVSANTKVVCTTLSSFRRQQIKLNYTRRRCPNVSTTLEMHALEKMKTLFV